MKSSTVLIGSILVAALIVILLTRPIDHDESQYVAATVLAEHFSLYRDFDYLQTPLQPWLLAPLLRLGFLPPLLFLRGINALLGTVSALIIGLSVRDLTSSRRWGWFGACLFVATEPFQFAATTARNDMLPLLCLCLSIRLLIAIRQHRDWQRKSLSAVLGAVMASAVAAKISYALPVVSLVIVELVARRGDERTLSLRFFALGCLPLAILVAKLILVAPNLAYFDILVFPRDAPTEWYDGLGRSFDLSIIGRLLAMTKFLLLGAGPVLLLAIFRRHGLITDQFGTAHDRWLRWQLLGLLGSGLIAAILPAPVWKQYLLPFFPPLFVLGSLALRYVWKDLRWRTAICFSAVLGSSISGFNCWAALSTGSPVFAFEQDATAIRLSLAKWDVHGPVASIAPEYVTEAGAMPDRRFAAGPFLFRTHDGLGQGWSLIGMSQATLPARLANDPPAAILVGGDATASGSQLVDADMRNAAIKAGFRPVANYRDGIGLWISRSRGESTAVMP